MAIKFEYTGKIGSGGMFDEDSVKKVTFELDDNDLTVQELLDEFQNFLKGVGYFFKDTQTFEVLDHDVSAKEKVLTPTDEEIAEEVSRLRSMTMGLSEEALLMSAHINLGNKKN